MRHANAILVSWLVIQVETEQRTCRQLDRSIGERADPELRTLQIGDQRERAAELFLDRPGEDGAARVLVVRAVREVEADRTAIGRPLSCSTLRTIS